MRDLRKLLTIVAVAATSLADLTAAVAPIVAEPYGRSVEQWALFELAVAGPTNGDPFLEVRFAGRFVQGYDSIEVPGFYDGNGVYRVRFMPKTQGKWGYATVSSAPELNGVTGEFTVIRPSAGNHGPVGVKNTFHFAYADGTPYKQLGTTCYVWTHQPEALQQQTLNTLAGSPFNKIRFCIFPKRYSWNTNEPPMYPFEGKPRNFDTTRFNPAFFQHFETRVRQLMELGIEADIILFHPYDRWGFSNMGEENDHRYLRYLVARLAAYRNVWWSLANEYDFMVHKTEEDWERIGQLAERPVFLARQPGLPGFAAWLGSLPERCIAPKNGANVQAGLHGQVVERVIIPEQRRAVNSLPKSAHTVTDDRPRTHFWSGIKNVYRRMKI